MRSIRGGSTARLAAVAPRDVPSESSSSVMLFRMRLSCAMAVVAACQARQWPASCERARQSLRRRRRGVRALVACHMQTHQQRADLPVAPQTSISLAKARERARVRSAARQAGCTGKQTMPVRGHSDAPSAFFLAASAATRSARGRGVSLQRTRVGTSADRPGSTHTRRQCQRAHDAPRKDKPRDDSWRPVCTQHARERRRGGCQRVRTVTRLHKRQCHAPARCSPPASSSRSVVVGVPTRVRGVSSAHSARVRQTVGRPGRRHRPAQPRRGPRTVKKTSPGRQVRCVHTARVQTARRRVSARGASQAAEWRQNAVARTDKSLGAQEAGAREAAR